MNTLRQGILTLIKSAILDKEHPLPDGFLLEEAFPILKKHQLIPIAYAGALKCGIDNTLPIMQEMFKIYYKLLIRINHQFKEFRRISKAFDENQIDYLPLKGLTINKLFPKPEYRCMGDLDIMIRMEQYEKIIPIMQSLGFEHKHESDHELVWFTKNCYVELHKRLIPSYNKDYYAFYGDGFTLASISEGTRYELSSNDEFIYLFTHFAKHYRDGGIGCRHIIDLWVYRRACPDLDETYISNQLKELQLYDFYKNICQLIRVWFEDASYDERTAFIENYIFESGSWGTLLNHNLSYAVKHSKKHEDITEYKKKEKWEVLFPNMDQMKKIYPFLPKAPFLLPIFWVHRWFAVLLFRRKNIKQRIKKYQDTDISHVQTFQDALNYVGLDFNFK